jgi:hypothetical protein
MEDREAPEGSADPGAYGAIGVDLLLTEDNDLAITKDGNTLYATGLTNYVQRVRVRLNTPRGSLIHAPNIGMPQVVGESIADIDNTEYRQAINNLLSDDPAFASTTPVRLRQVGGTRLVDVDVMPSGLSSVLPLTFHYI